MFQIESMILRVKVMLQYSYSNALDDETLLEILSPVLERGIERQSLLYMHRIRKIRMVMARYVSPNEI